MVIVWVMNRFFTTLKKTSVHSDNNIKGISMQLGHTVFFVFFFLIYLMLLFLFHKSDKLCRNWLEKLLYLAFLCLSIDSSSLYPFTSLQLRNRVTYPKEAERLNAYHQKPVKNTLNIRWPKKIAKKNRFTEFAKKSQEKSRKGKSYRLAGIYLVVFYKETKTSMQL